MTVLSDLAMASLGLKPQGRHTHSLTDYRDCPSLHLVFPSIPNVHYYRYLNVRIMMYKMNAILNDTSVASRLYAVFSLMK